MYGNSILMEYVWKRILLDYVWKLILGYVWKLNSSRMRMETKYFWDTYGN
jgi:hypothetical protein